MDYKTTLDFLYSQMPAFHKIGADAYKPGLERVLELSGCFGNPHKRIKTVHIAGTNGKGSTAHSLASVFQAAGYKTGLFTSPHIVDFRERIRVDGEMIPEEYVISFVERFRALPQSISPSFFELTTVMAFDYFASMEVDVAIIEVGLGGRLDSTNIINPGLSVITNISLDHTSLLGNTEVEISREKAGIIKRSVPVVVGEAQGEVRTCFEAKAKGLSSPIYFAEDSQEIISWRESDKGIEYKTRHFGFFTGCLKGDFQIKNMATILEAVRVINKDGVFRLGTQAVADGLYKVVDNTGLKGRWMQIAKEPLTICDTGHNPGGWMYISELLKSFHGLKHIVIGFVNDKDVSEILSMVSSVPDARFYFTAPSTSRALPAEMLCRVAGTYGLVGNDYATVAEAYETALEAIGDKGGEMIFVGGSNFVVADLMDHLLNVKQ